MLLDFVVLTFAWCVPAADMAVVGRGARRRRRLHRVSQEGALPPAYKKRFQCKLLYSS